MGSGKVNMVVFLMVMGVAALQIHTSTAQTTHVVLDSLGWTIPQNGAAAYTAWASTKTFTVGDTLVFNFPANAHTVAEITKAAFDACTTTATLSNWTTPPARVTLKSPGDHYYLCTIPGHCSLGQKLAISVTAAASTPPPAPTPSPSATPPPAAASTPPPAPTPSPPATPTPAASGPSPSPSATPPAPSSGVTPPAPGSNTTPSSPSPASVTVPPPPNSAASFAAAALPVTFLSVVIALFY